MKAYAVVSEQGSVQRIIYADNTPDVEEFFTVVELENMPSYPSKKPWQRIIVVDRQIVLEDTRNLNGLKEAKRVEITDMRKALEVAPIMWDNSEFDADPDSILRILAAIGMVSADTAITWTLADNTTRSMIKIDLENLLAAIGTRANDLHSKARSLKAQVDAALSIEELIQITW